MSVSEADTRHGKTPKASEAVVADLMMPHQANGLRRPSVFGGVIMSMVDRCAALSASASSPSSIWTTTASRPPCPGSAWTRRKIT